MRFVIDARYVRERPSGIGVYVAELAERLPALAPNDTFRFWTHRERPRISDAPNVSHHPVDAVGDGFDTMFRPSALDRLRDDDVMHFPFNILGHGLRCASVATVMDTMWVEQPHLVDRRPLVRRLRAPFYRHGTLRALTHATRILTITAATADRLICLVPSARSRITVTHCAVGPEFSLAVDEAASRGRATELLGTDANYFIVVGKNQPYKAHEVAVRAFAAASDDSERLVLVQREDVGVGLSALVRELGISARVSWLSNITRADLVELLRNAVALLQPSIVEGFGIPVLEAMACGCPVVASDTAALVEVMDGAGIHAPVADAQALAEAMTRLGDGALRAELREQGLSRAKDFSWDTAASTTLAVYREAQRVGPLR